MKYVLRCPECNMHIKRMDKKEIEDTIGQTIICYSCEAEFDISTQDISNAVQNK